MAEDKGDDNVNSSGKDIGELTNKILDNLFGDEDGRGEKAGLNKFKDKQERLERIKAQIIELQGRIRYASLSEKAALLARMSELMADIEGMGDSGMMFLASNILKQEFLNYYMEVDSLVQQINAGTDKLSESISFSEEPFLAALGLAKEERLEFASLVGEYLKSVDEKSIEENYNRVMSDTHVLLDKESLRKYFYTEEELAHRRHLQRKQRELEEKFEPLYDQAIVQYEILAKLEERREYLGSVLEKYDKGSRKGRGDGSKSTAEESSKEQKTRRGELTSAIERVDNQIAQVQERIDVFEQEVEEKDKAVEKVSKLDEKRAAILHHQEEVLRASVERENKVQRRLESKKEEMLSSGASTEELVEVERQISTAVRDAAEKSALAKEVEVAAKQASVEAERFVAKESDKKARLKALSAARRKKQSLGDKKLVREKSREITRGIKGIKFVDEDLNEKAGTLKPDSSIGKKPNPDKTRPR